MRKIIVSFVLISLFVGILAPVIALADGEEIRECCKVRRLIEFGNDYGGTCTAGQIAAPDATAAAVCGGGAVCGFEEWGMFCVVTTIYYVTDWIFYLLMILVVILFIAAGAIYLTSGGNADAKTRAKNIMIYAIVGLVVALVAKLVPSVVKLIVAM